MTSFNRSLAVCVLVSISIARNEVLAAADGEPMQTDVFVSDTEGYHTYRIPSLIVTKAGTVLAICEGRKTGVSAPQNHC